MSAGTADTIPVAKKKTTGGKPGVRKGWPLMLYVDDAIKPAVEAFTAAQRLKPTLKAIVELALMDFLEREGYWPYPPKKS